MPLHLPSSLYRFAGVFLAVLLSVSMGVDREAHAQTSVRGTSLVPSGSSWLDISDAMLHYTVERNVTVYLEPDFKRPYVVLGFREDVHVVDRAVDWVRVRTLDGAQGYIRPGDLSNLWILVSKTRQTVYVYEGIHLRHAFPADLGHNFFDDKEQRGSMTNPDDWRTPEGIFFVSNKNRYSKFHKALVLNYPNPEDAERGLGDGLITDAQYRAILTAARDFRNPPMNTLLGGWIEIHGDGTGARSNWTQGCVAIHNDHIDAIWDLVHVGTPVLIER